MDGIIKCKDCSSGRMLKCINCILSTHEDLPLHRVEVCLFNHLTLKESADAKHQRWNGNFFEKDSLQNLGLRYQLGHSSAPCPCPYPGPANFIVFDPSGPHNISINYCQCGNVEKNHCLSGPSYSVKDGFLQPSRVLKPSSVSIVLRHSMNSHYRERQISTTTTIPFYEDQITQISQHQL